MFVVLLFHQKFNWIIEWFYYIYYCCLWTLLLFQWNKLQQQIYTNHFIRSKIFTVRKGYMVILSINYINKWTFYNNFYICFVFAGARARAMYYILYGMVHTGFCRYAKDHNTQYEICKIICGINWFDCCIRLVIHNNILLMAITIYFFQLTNIL